MMLRSRLGLARSFFVAALAVLCGLRPRFAVMRTCLLESDDDGIFDETPAKIVPSDVAPERFSHSFRFDRGIPGERIEFQLDTTDPAPIIDSLLVKEPLIQRWPGRRMPLPG